MSRPATPPQLWILLIYLAHRFEGGAAVDVDGCDLGRDLVTDASLIEDNVIRNEGFYLLMEGASCEGRIAIIDLCGVFTSALASPTHFFAAIYRPTTINGSSGYDRITDPIHFDIDPALLAAESRQSCVGLPVIENWSVEVGDTIGYSFTNSCVTETLELGIFPQRIRTVSVCPVYTALRTSSLNDSVYFSPNLSTNSSYFSQEELSIISEVTMNIKAPIEPFPPLYSKVCKNEIPAKYSTNVSRSPPASQLFTGGGTFIMTNTAEISGRVTSLEYCGFLNVEEYPETGPDVQYFFTVLHLRKNSSNYNRLDILKTELVNYRSDSAVDTENTSSNLRCGSHQLANRWRVREGDHFGIIIGAQCTFGFCPIQTALINTGCERMSIFEPIYLVPSQPFIDVENASLVATTINVEFNITERTRQIQTPSDTESDSDLTYIVYIVLGVLFVITVSLIAILLTLLKRLKRTKPQQYQSVIRRIHVGSIRLREGFRTSSRRENRIEAVPSRSYSEQNEYSIHGSQVVDKPFTAPYTDNIGANVHTQHLFLHHQASTLTGSYATPIDAVKHHRNTDSSLYSDPPQEERDLKVQIKNLEVRRDQITLQDYLGSGQFGVVYHGLLKLSDSEGEVKEVAVKTMENGASEEDRIRFLQEAAIMGQFNNQYIIKIFGVHISSQPFMIICELMKKGDLRRHLHNIKLSGYYISSQQNNDLGKILLDFSRQVACAMLYLSDKGFVHRDLAARNILVSVEGICKIADFGLSRDLQDEDYYVSHGGLVPVRWTAPEAIQYRKYSTASDVWSFGIVLYEIWSLAIKPYKTLTNEQVLHQVFKGHRLAPPSGCPKAMYAAMISCWHPDPGNRPTFNMLNNTLHKPDSIMLLWTEEDRVLYSEEARTIGGAYHNGQTLYSDLQKTYYATLSTP